MMLVQMVVSWWTVSLVSALDMLRVPEDTLTQTPHVCEFFENAKSDIFTEF